MKLTLQTASYCPTCYAEIPAEVSVTRDGVCMRKSCLVHGPVEALVERDPNYFMMCRARNDRNIYDGFFIDVTNRCNLKCQYCFHPCNTVKDDPSLASIVQECRLVNAPPYIMTGGEATLRDDLLDLIAALPSRGPGDVCMVTNGVKLADPVLAEAVAHALMCSPDLTRIDLSIHPEAGDKPMVALENLRNSGYQVESALIVIDKIDDMENAVAFARDNRDAVKTLRIKGATKLWAEDKPAEKVFVSDMWNWLEERGEVRLVNGSFAKTSFAHVHWQNLDLMLVSWYDRFNIDLRDIACPPLYRAKNGRVCNFVTGCMINEGMDKGWLNGRRLS